MGCRPASRRESFIVGMRRLCDGSCADDSVGHRTRQVCIRNLTERANALIPYLPRLRYARRAVDDGQEVSNPPGGVRGRAGRCSVPSR